MKQSCEVEMIYAILACIGTLFLASCVMIYVDEEHGQAMGCLSALVTLAVMAILWMTFPVAALILGLIGVLWWRVSDAKIKR